MSKHSHISAIFDNAFQIRAGSPDEYNYVNGPDTKQFFANTEETTIFFSERDQNI